MNNNFYLYLLIQLLNIIFSFIKKMHKLKTQPTQEIPQLHQAFKKKVNIVILSDKKKEKDNEVLKNNDLVQHSAKISSNWFLKIIIITYLSQTPDLKIQLQVFSDKIKKNEIKICCCSQQSVPKYLSEKYYKEFLTQLLDSHIDLLGSISQSENQQKIKQQKLIKLILEEPYLQFLFNLLIRAITIQNCKKLINHNEIDYLGNQIEVLKDYSCNPEYKIIRLIASTFKFNIFLTYKTQNHELIQQYLDDQTLLTLYITKQAQNVYFKMKNNHEREINKKSISTESSAKDVLKNFFDKTIHQNPTEKSHSKVCPKCGQMRKQSQKFCICRKHKITSNVSIPIKFY